jgi:hypothetical protein
MTYKGKTDWSETPNHPFAHSQISFGLKRPGTPQTMMRWAIGVIIASASGAMGSSARAAAASAARLTPWRRNIASGTGQAQA